VPMTIKTDGSDFDVPLPLFVALPGGTVGLQFVITGERPQALNPIVRGTPTNEPPLEAFPPVVSEVFVIDERQNALQLTSFGRVDTWYPLVDVDRKGVYFAASADPLGTNPSNNCQLFSIDRLGRNLRQLTNFGELAHATAGCTFDVQPRECAISTLYQDRRTRALIFYSSCDPLGTNPKGGQIFAIQPDGTGLRQLTASRGLVREAAGVYLGELPGPWAYGPYEP